MHIIGMYIPMSSSAILMERRGLDKYSETVSVFTVFLPLNPTYIMLLELSSQMEHNSAQCVSQPPYSDYDSKVVE